MSITRDKGNKFLNIVSLVGVGAEVYKKILQYEHFIEDNDELLTIGEFQKTRFGVTSIFV